MPLIIHSKSTKKYAKKIANEYDNAKLLDVSKIEKPEPLKDPVVIGIGGGKVIDYAKIIAGEYRAIAIPTTASGASSTSHAVFWDYDTKRKIDIPTQKPVIRLESDFLEGLAKKTIHETSCDALAHSLDSYWSKNRTNISKELALKAYKIIIDQIENNFNDLAKLIKAGNIAGEAIDITGTNMTHAISYPLTAIYGVSHGFAVGWAINPIAEYQECELFVPKLNYKQINKLNNYINIKTVAEQAMTYRKIHDAKKDITLNKLIELLRKFK